MGLRIFLGVGTVVAIAGTVVDTAGAPISNVYVDFHVRDGGDLICIVAAVTDGLGDYLSPTNLAPDT